MFIDELKDFIEDNTSLVFGTDLFIGNLPEGVNNCVVLQLSMTDNFYELGNTKGYYTCDIAIRVRGNQTENATRALADTIQGALENIFETFENYRIVRGAFETPMYQLDGTDQNNNYVFVGIFRAIIEDILQ